RFGETFDSLFQIRLLESLPYIDAGFKCGNRREPVSDFKRTGYESLRKYHHASAALAQREVRCQVTGGKQGRERDPLPLQDIHGAFVRNRIRIREEWKRPSRHVAELFRYDKGELFTPVESCSLLLVLQQHQHDVEKSTLELL